MKGGRRNFSFGKRRWRRRRAATSSARRRARGRRAAAGGEAARCGSRGEVGVGPLEQRRREGAIRCSCQIWPNLADFVPARFAKISQCFWFFSWSFFENSLTTGNYLEFPSIPVCFFSFFFLTTTMRARAPAPSLVGLDEKDWKFCTYQKNSTAEQKTESS